jgi:hypothetical protein
MEKIGLLALLEARAGKESAVKDFLESARTLALQEEDTISWLAFRVGPTTFGIFDTFADEDGRSAHLNGDIAKTLLARAEEHCCLPTPDPDGRYPGSQIVQNLIAATAKLSATHVSLLIFGHPKCTSTSW